MLTLMSQIRAKTYFENSPIVFICEAAPGNSASYIRVLMEGEPNVHFMCERPGGGEGVLKTDKITEGLRSEFDLQVTNQNIRICNDVIVYHDPRPRPGQVQNSGARQVGILQTQLKNFEYMELPRKNNHEPPRYKLTGKGGGKNDDLAISAMMIPYWSRRFWAYASKPEYVDAQRQCIQMRGVPVC